MECLWGLGVSLEPDKYTNSCYSVHLFSTRSNLQLWGPQITAAHGRFASPQRAGTKEPGVFTLFGLYLADYYCLINHWNEPTFIYSRIGWKTFPLREMMSSALQQRTQPHRHDYPKGTIINVTLLWLCSAQICTTSCNTFVLTCNQHFLLVQSNIFKPVVFTNEAPLLENRMKTDRKQIHRCMSGFWRKNCRGLATTGNNNSPSGNTDSNLFKDKDLLKFALLFFYAVTFFDKHTILSIGCI